MDPEDSHHALEGILRIHAELAKEFLAKSEQYDSLGLKEVSCKYALYAWAHAVNAEKTGLMNISFELLHPYDGCPFRYDQWKEISRAQEFAAYLFMQEIDGLEAIFLSMA